MYQLRPDHNAVLTTPLIATWKFDGGSQINGGLALSGGTIFVATFGGDLYALNAFSGEPRWHARGNGKILMSTPIIVDGLVYVGSGKNGRLVKPEDADFAYTPNASGNPIWGEAGGDDLMAFDEQTGSSAWSLHTVGEDMPSPGFADGRLIFANGDLRLYGVDARTGATVWKRELDGLATMASTTIASGHAYISYCNDAPYRCYTESLQPANGETIWRAPFGNSDSSPTVADRRVFVSGVQDVLGPYEHEGRTIVAALNESDGRPLWQYKTPPGPYSQVGSSERAIAGTYSEGTYFQAWPEGDEILAFDAQTGRVRWVFKTSAPVKMSPVIYRGRLYVGDVAGLLYVLDSSTGRLKSARSFNQPFTTSPPLISGDTIFFATYSTVYAIRLT